MTQPCPPYTPIVGAIVLVVCTGLALPNLGGATEQLRLDAETAAALAVDSSPLARAADAHVAAMESQVASADAERMPLISIAAQVAHRSSVPEFAVPFNGPTQEPTVVFPNIRNTYTLGAQATQVLFSGGRITAHRHASAMEAETAGGERDVVLASLRLQARIAFWRAFAAEAGVHAAETEVARADRLVDDAAAFVEAGLAVQADLLAAEARSSDARLRLVDTKAERERSLAELRSLIGQIPGVEIELVGQMKAPARPETLSELLDEARSQRPELDAARLRVETARAREAVARAGTSPSLQLSTGWELARPNQRHLPLSDTWNDSLYIALGASWTVFDGQRTAAAVATAHALTDALRADALESTRTVLLEVETARIQLQSAIEATEVAEVAKRAAAARERAEQDRYQAGISPIADLLDAQAELAIAEKNQIKARAAAWTAAAVLDRAVGR